jgi:ATP-dependent Lon protease
MTNLISGGETITLPLLPLRDVVVFPHMVIPLFVGRPKSIKALETAMEAGKSIVLVAQQAQPSGWRLSCSNAGRISNCRETCSSS